MIIMIITIMTIDIQKMVVKVWQSTFCPYLAHPFSKEKNQSHYFLSSFRTWHTSLISTLFSGIMFMLIEKPTMLDTKPSRSHCIKFALFYFIFDLWKMWGYVIVSVHLSGCPAGVVRPATRVQKLVTELAFLFNFIRL